MKKASKLTILALTSLSLLPGCADTSSYWWAKDIPFEGYTATASLDGGGRRAKVVDESISTSTGKGWVGAVDGDNDGRFDEIHIYVPKGHVLEKYASLKELERVYSVVEAQREK